MKLNLFCLLCLTGLMSVTRSIPRTVPHKYHFNLTAMTWYNAQSSCRSKYNDLATILSTTDWIRLKRPATTPILYPLTWIGLHIDIYDFYWILNQTPLSNVMFKNWYPGQPDNYHLQESCVVLSYYNQWHDLQCTHLRPFICYNANFTGAARFVRVTISKAWPDARAYCQTYHTDLASALNSSDHQYFMQIRAIQGDSWIGLYRPQDIWKWSDGTSASNIPWATGQPNNYYRRENCGLLYRGYFHDEPCTNQRYFYCHTDYPWRSQVMKLKVTSSGTMLDPAEHSAILQQIIQKLEDNGLVMENIKVTWRVQPDGNIFQKMNKNDL